MVPEVSSASTLPVPERIGAVVVEVMEERKLPMVPEPVPERIGAVVVEVMEPISLNGPKPSLPSIPRFPTSCPVPSRPLPSRRKRNPVHSRRIPTPSPVALSCSPVAAHPDGSRLAQSPSSTQPLLHHLTRSHAAQKNCHGYDHITNPLLHAGHRLRHRKLEVILTTTINKLGKAGETVKVAPGHFRNHLMPKLLAVPNIEKFARLVREQRETIPISFVRKHKLRSQWSVSLHDPCGRAWPVGVRCCKDGRVDLGTGMGPFFRGNNMEDGDHSIITVCGFSCGCMRSGSNVFVCMNILWNLMQEFLQ